MREIHLTHRAVPTGTPARINLTLAEGDGTTTKINAPGPELAPKLLQSLVSEIGRETVGAQWAVLSGSLPPGAPAGWYADVIAQVAGEGLSIAVDTSGAPLREAVRREARRIDVIKPNAEELADLVGVDPASLTSVDAVVAADASPIQARSTVGAGDSALAGYLLGALDDLDPAKRLSLAVAYGSAAAALPGSTMPGPSDLPPLSDARPWNKG